MKRRISLYIAGKRVDLDNQSFILFNYKQEDLDNPTIVKNSYSQQITLKGTATNNKVFNDAFRLDRVSGTGFNPRLKTSFVIYNELNEILESGYAKLDAVTHKGADTQYSVTLYGGLGEFLYALSYKESGDALTLADLDYLQTATPTTEFNYTINRTLVGNAWSVLAGEAQNELFETINFAPAYNGIPSDFEADKAVFDGSLMAKSGILTAELSRDYTEREMQDLRSYLQRPVIRFKSIISAIQRFATGLGYTFNIGSWDSNANPYWEDLWLTLPILKDKRSGDTITKKDLLSGTSTPADYLLSYAKMLGLKLTCEEMTITLEERDDFFRDNVIDLTKRLDLTDGVNITPFVMDSKWYEMVSEDKGEYASYYKTAYGRTYGAHRINTGYEFNSESKPITDSIVFKGGVQSCEKSNAFMNAYKEIGGTNRDFPAAFLNGGSYSVEEGGETNEYSLLGGRLSFSWWNTAHNGYDLNDLVQLHEADNKAMDGNNVLLFFNSMVDCPAQMRLSDDVTEMGDSPCWNCSSSNVNTISQTPHFCRFFMQDSSNIANTLDWGQVAELNIPDYAYGTNSGYVFKNRWKAYLSDRYDENTKMVKVKVNLSGMQVNQDLLRYFYWFGGSLWVLNSISNYSLTTNDPVECEFVQVQNKNNYLNGQTI